MAAAPAADAPWTDDEHLEMLECARYGEVEDVVAMLDAGADANFRDAAGNTALHRAAANGHVAVVSLLADRGAAFTANSNGNTPLHWAAVNGHAEVVAALLDRFGGQPGVDPLAKNAFGKSALTDAINAGHEDIARTILAHSSADGISGGKGGGSGAPAGAGGGAGAAADLDEEMEDGGEDVEGDDDDADLLNGEEDAGRGGAAEHEDNLAGSGR